MRIETLAVHAGHQIDPATGAVASPIYLSTTFEREADGSYPHGYNYTRSDNPNRQALEDCLSALEGGSAAAAFASGSAATMSIFQSLAPGDHVLAPNDAYYGTAHLLKNTFARWGLQITFVDMSDLQAVQQAVQANTKLLWLETPSNPLLKISDIARLAELAHQVGALCACDNTWAPIAQRPFDLGADLIVHSTTKYLGGHSDVLGGVVVTRQDNEFFQRIRQVQQTGGAVPSPFDCWLVLRGVRTLPLRLRAHTENALKLATFLSQHPIVAAVHYPGLQSHPGYEVASQQMSLFGGMLSFQVQGGREPAFAVAARVKLFTRATSLGAVESLLEHRASIEGPTSQTPQNLLRVSVGLEHADDLIEDLAQALAPLVQG
ncbi:PLP-dependent aspartate aminotransferase family protein [Leptolyngbya sp. FACHB-261]|uniref:trans-sulfuration enzyme family protein n=1 Tax=Leptolyngbya sp. FACHB-261 TaxID=2692806 RepID=UPI00168311B9|nr:aminotransferase class V-fold PLP-dependent enzyme [Leptolyngbya sp. FACHB-261]MBD2100556.1 aminotransferase class V-fold PLP-dependent enzyme [Leptolyngbya sp. FACHB-261]